MPPDARPAPDLPAVLTAADRGRHALLTPLTIIQMRTPLLQRQLAGMDGLAPQDQRRLAAGLAEVLGCARELTGRIEALLPPRPETDGD